MREARAWPFSAIQPSTSPIRLEGRGQSRRKTTKLQKRGIDKELPLPPGKSNDTINNWASLLVLRQLFLLVVIWAMGTAFMGGM